MDLWLWPILSVVCRSPPHGLAPQNSGQHTVCLNWPINDHHAYLIVKGALRLLGTIFRSVRSHLLYLDRAIQVEDRGCTGLRILPWWSEEVEANKLSERGSLHSKTLEAFEQDRYRPMFLHLTKRLFRQWRWQHSGHGTLSSDTILSVYAAWDCQLMDNRSEGKDV